MFDSFVDLTQNSDDGLKKKFGLYFLEIYYHLFKDFRPIDLCNVKTQASPKYMLDDSFTTQDQKRLSKIERKEEQKNRDQDATKSHHSRFGGKLRLKN